MNQKFKEFSKFRISDKSLKRELGSIFKILSAILCLAGTVVASYWSLTQEMVSSNSNLKI